MEKKNEIKKTGLNPWYSGKRVIISFVDEGATQTVSKSLV